MTDNYASVPCPLPGCGTPLHIVWHASYSLYAVDLRCGETLPSVTHAHAVTWRVECEDVHVILTPGETGCGCDDAGGSDCPHNDSDYDWSEDCRSFTSHDRERLLILISQLAVQP